MDALAEGGGSSSNAAGAALPATAPRTETGRTGHRPLREWTIRELIVELGKVEDAQAHRSDGDRTDRAERSLAQRERLIIAELHRRRSQDPVPVHWWSRDARRTA